jgi:hypothetical protein
LAEQTAANCPLRSPPEKYKILKWTGSAIELVELVYALYESESFGKTPLKTLFNSFCNIFDCEITNYYRLFWDIKNRTSENRAKFLDELKRLLVRKIEEADRK